MSGRKRRRGDAATREEGRRERGRHAREVRRGGEDVERAHGHKNKEPWVRCDAMRWCVRTRGYIRPANGLPRRLTLPEERAAEAALRAAVPQHMLHGRRGHEKASKISTTTTTARRERNGTRRTTTMMDMVRRSKRKATNCAGRAGVAITCLAYAAHRERRDGLTKESCGREGGRGVCEFDLVNEGLVGRSGSR